MSRSFLLRFRRVLNSTIVSALFLVIVIGGLAYIAYNVTESVQVKPDFGGIVTIRQANLGIGAEEDDATRLTLKMISDTVLARPIVESLANKYEWDLPYEEIVKCIDIKERLADQHSFVIMVNSKEAERSSAIAKDLGYYFLMEYHKKWKSISSAKLEVCQKEIEACNAEIIRLNDLKKRFKNSEGLQPLNTEIELMSINEQLLAAQTQFLTAFGAFIARLEQIRFDTEMALEVAKQENTERSPIVKNLQRKLEIITKQCNSNKELMKKHSPNIYQMEIDAPELVGVPTDIAFYYENIQRLQQLKLAILIDSIIKDKESQLSTEQKKKSTIERLLSSNSSDVFIREGN